MGRTLKFESPSRLSKFKRTMNSVESSSRLSLRDWKRSKNRNAIDMECLTELPVPTVPPYPIEYFEENENCLSHVNMAFKFSEEYVPPPAFNHDKLHSAFEHPKKDEAHDSDSKGGSPSEDSRESVGGSTVDSGVVLHSGMSRRTSGNSADFRTSPDGRDDKPYNVDRPGQASVSSALGNNARFDSAPRIHPLGYSTHPFRPIHVRSSSGTTHPISNGTLLHSNDHANKLKSGIQVQAIQNYQDFRSMGPASKFTQPIRVSSMPLSHEPTYVNRPSIPAPLPDGCGPPPYPGTSQLPKFGAFRPPPLKRTDPSQPLPLLGSQIRSQLWQTSAASSKPCGRSKSVHDECRKTDAHRSRLGSINTLGIPYQTTLPARLSKKSIPSYSEASHNQMRASNSSKPDTVFKVPLNNVKVTTQPCSPFKKAVTPVYSKVCKQKKTKKTNVPYEGLHSKLLGNDKPQKQSYSSTGSTETGNPSPEVDTPDGAIRVDKTKPIENKSLVCRSRSEDGLLSMDGYSSPLYEELLQLQDEGNEDGNGQYSIEVRIDYSKGTKYKVEKRRRLPVQNNDSDNNNNKNNEMQDKKSSPKSNAVQVQHDTSVNSEKLKQFRQDKKSLSSGKVRSNSDVISFKNSQFLNRFRKMTICCCG